MSVSDEARRLARFGLVGAGAAVIHVGVASVVFWLSGRLLASHAAGFAAAFAVAAPAHFYFTFQAENRFWSRSGAYLAV